MDTAFSGVNLLSPIYIGASTISTKIGTTPIIITFAMREPYALWSKRAELKVLAVLLVRKVMSNTPTPINRFFRYLIGNILSDFIQRGKNNLVAIVSLSGEQFKKLLCQTVLTCYIPEPIIHHLINNVSFFGGPYGAIKRIV